MTAINDLKTWQEYCRIKQVVLNDWRQKDNIPAEFKAYFEKSLSIKDLSHELVVNILCLYAKHITGGVFNIDGDNKKTLDLIAQYLREDEAFLKVNPSYSFKKGLLIHGPVGTGKTVLFKALSVMYGGLVFYNPNTEFHETGLSGCFKIISANEIARRFSIKGNEIFIDDYRDLIERPICIDDFGSEPEAAHYGQKTNIIAEILQERYEHRSLTHISSNLNVNAIKDAYGLRVFDRMKEMFCDIPLTGNSRRK